MLVKWAKDKPIMEKKVSAKNIQMKFNKMPKKFKEKKMKKKYLFQLRIECLINLSESQK